MRGCQIPECLCVCCNKIKERLDKLEKENEMRQHAIVGIDRYYVWECRQLSERMDSLEKSFNQKLKVDYQKWIEYFNANLGKKKPHKCPVCDGKGKLFPDKMQVGMTWDIKTNNQVCDSCEGKGIVWG